MTRFVCLALIVVCATACQASPPPPAAGPVAPWEPVDSAFAGCQGACGSHVGGPRADIVEQPGATPGQQTYCPVSGAVFRIDAAHPHVEVDGQTLWFCCAGCAAYFREHREAVLSARGIAHRAPRASSAPPSPSYASNRSR